MLTLEVVKDLISYRPGHPVLSVFLNADPSEGSADVYRLRLRQMLKEYEATMPQDAETIERFVEHEYDWSGRSLALFSCKPDRFFRSFSLSVPIRDRARALNRPYVKPLADLLDSYGHYGVCLVDRQGARLFHFHVGQLWEEKGTIGESVRHTKRGGGSQAPGRRGGVAGQTRYSEEVVERNLKEAAKFASRFFQDRRTRRVLVGGTESNVARFVEALPKKWRSLVVGTFPIEMTAGHSEVLDRAMEVARQAEHKKEAQLVKAVITAAAKGREGVVRLDDTLSAVHSGRVQTLVLQDGFRAAGYRCKGCDYLTAQELGQCPFCGSEIERIRDAVELIVRKVMQDGGDVVVVRDNADLEQAGKIGGLMRY